MRGKVALSVEVVKKLREHYLSLKEDGYRLQMFYTVQASRYGVSKETIHMACWGKGVYANEEYSL